MAKHSFSEHLPTERGYYWFTYGVFVGLVDIIPDNINDSGEIYCSYGDGRVLTLKEFIGFAEDADMLWCGPIDHPDLPNKIYDDDNPIVQEENVLLRNKE